MPMVIYPPEIQQKATTIISPKSIIPHHQIPSHRINDHANLGQNKVLSSSQIASSKTMSKTGTANPADNTQLRNLALDVRRQIDAFLQESTDDDSLLRNVQTRTRASLAVIEEALSRYSLDALSLSYNGGKDCLVLLILYLGALATYPSPLPASLRSIYIVSPDPFAQVESFTLATAEKYHLALYREERSNMREAFADYLSPDGHGKDVKAILVGTRRTDPHGAQLSNFAPTDGKWPAFMRVNAVIDWRYCEIWKFILHLNIPYCELYDLGYTSLGGTSDTHPNPALLLKDDDECGRIAPDGKRYRPAHELREDDEERLGRDW